MGQLADSLLMSNLMGFLYTLMLLLPTILHLHPHTHLHQLHLLNLLQKNLHLKLLPLLNLPLLCMPPHPLLFTNQHLVNSYSEYINY